MLPGEWSMHFENLMRSFFSSGHRDASQITKYFDNIEIPLVGGYGASTTCVEVLSAQSQIIIDGGSGIRQLSERLMTGTHSRRAARSTST